MDETATGGPSFTKELLLQSEKYEDYVDILEALLDDDKLYTSEQVDSLISTFMKRSVN